MVEITINKKGTKKLVAEFQATGNKWLGINYQYLFAWLTKEYGLTNLEFGREDYEINGEIDEEHKMSSFMLLKHG